MRTLFHITKRSEWERAQELSYYAAPSLELEGFIHFSRPHQVQGVAARHFKGQTDLVLLQIAEEKLKGELKYEGEPEKYPHLYGRLNLGAVLAVHAFVEESGSFRLPKGFKMSADTLIRKGLPGDEAELSSVHTHAWQQSYRGLVPDEILDTRPLTFRNRLTWWRGVVEECVPTCVFVAESAQHGIVGFCATEPARDEEFEGYGEIGAIYLLNEYKGKGVGGALFKAGKEWLEEQGYKKIYLWVLKDNPTINFYKRMGGERLPNEKIIEIGRPLTEIAFAWR